MNNHEAPIIQKVYNFYQELSQVIEKMPKRNRYALGQKLDQTSLELTELLIGASNTTGKVKFKYLKQASIKLDLLKILLRMGQEIKAIPTKRYLALEEMLQEIGKMLGGWLRFIG